MRHLTLLAVLLASLPAPALPCSEPVLIVTGERSDSVPGDGDPAFPHDGVPLVRLGNALVDQLGEDARPGLFDEGGAEIPTTLETRVLRDEVGFAEWIRLVPDAALPEGERFELRLTDPRGDDQEDLDAIFVPVSFETGPSTLEVPREAPEIDLEVIDHGSRPGGLGPCGAFPARHEQTATVSLATAPADFQPHDQWRFIVVANDTPDDLADAHHRALVDPRTLDDDATEIASWRYNASTAATEARCVIAVVEDAYGRTTEADPVCVTPVASCASGCSAADAQPASGAMLLAGVAGLTGRRRRR